MCVEKVVGQDYGCRNVDGFLPKTAARNGQPGVIASVCLPGSPGWVGARCLAASDCKNGTTCGADGLCTESCTHLCPDMPGFADTFCTASTMSCERQCTPESNASECEGGTQCVLQDRAGGGSQRYVCE
jgi:hypothetical protein